MSLLICDFQITWTYNGMTLSFKELIVQTESLLQAVTFKTNKSILRKSVACLGRPTQ